VFSFSVLFVVAYVFVSFSVSCCLRYCVTSFLLFVFCSVGYVVTSVLVRQRCLSMRYVSPSVCLSSVCLSVMSVCMYFFMALRHSSGYVCLHVCIIPAIMSAFHFSIPDCCVVYMSFIVCLYFLYVCLYVFPFVGIYCICVIIVWRYFCFISVCMYVFTFVCLISSLMFSLFVLCLYRCNFVFCIMLFMYVSVLFLLFSLLSACILVFILCLCLLFCLSVCFCISFCFIAFSLYVVQFGFFYILIIFSCAFVFIIARLSLYVFVVYACVPFGISLLVYILLDICMCVYVWCVFIHYCL